MANPLAKKIPMTGVGVIITRDFDGVPKILAGERTKTHGNGCLSFPGGHLEHFETWRECAKRETEEETGLKIKFPSSYPEVFPPPAFECTDNYSFVTNNIMDDNHYTTVWLLANWESGEAEVLDGKHKSWDWYTLHELVDAVEKEPKPHQDHWVPVGLLWSRQNSWNLVECQL